VKDWVAVKKLANRGTQLGKNTPARGQETTRADREGPWWTSQKKKRGNKTGLSMNGDHINQTTGKERKDRPKKKLGQGYGGLSHVAPNGSRTGKDEHLNLRSKKENAEESFKKGKEAAEGRAENRKNLGPSRRFSKLRVGWGSWRKGKKASGEFS